jgi:membrane protein implicated in regulation of membrane protease activity
LDILTMATCLSIGSAVSWLIALYTRRGTEFLLWDFPFATMGAALCAIAVAWIAPRLGILGLVLAGPVFAVLMLSVGDVIRRMLGRALRRQRNADPRARP